MVFLINYQQLANTRNVSAFGGELEARLNLKFGLSLMGHFGFFLGSQTTSNGTDEEPVAELLLHAAGIQGGLQLAYQTKLTKTVGFIASLGALYVGTKLVGIVSYQGDATLPAKDINNKEIDQKAPTWDGSKQEPRSPDLDPNGDPGPIAPGYLQLDLTLQFVNLFDHFDFIIRGKNITGAFTPSYDAGDPFLYPRKGLELMAFIRVHY